MRHRSWALLLLLPAAAFTVVVVTAPFPNFHQRLVTSGSRDRFLAAVVRAGRADARGALWLDNVFVLTWLAVAPRLLRTGLARWAPDPRHRLGPWRHAPVVAIAAGAADLVENGLALALIGEAHPASALVVLLAVLAVAKWVLYVAALVGLAGLVVGPLAQGIRRT